MARPQTASDEDILQAALRVIVRRGHDEFTLSEVAEEVGLSRAAVILRFKGTAALKLTLTAHIVERFEQALRSLPVSCSGDGLLELVAFIGRKITSQGSLTAFMRTFHSNIKDSELAKLEMRRAQALRDAVAERMPATVIAHDSAVTAFVAHIGGCVMQWEVAGDADACSYLVERTIEWLKLARVPYSQRVATASARLAVAS